jgi:hypothetical protein
MQPLGLNFQLQKKKKKDKKKWPYSNLWENELGIFNLKFIMIFMEIKKAYTTICKALSLSPSTSIKGLQFKI